MIDAIGERKLDPHTHKIAALTVSILVIALLTAVYITAADVDTAITGPSDSQWHTNDFTVTVNDQGRTSGKLDVVYVVDTSGSFEDEWKTLKNNINSINDDIRSNSDINLDDTVYGTPNTYQGAASYATRICMEGQTLSDPLACGDRNDPNDGHYPIIDGLTSMQPYFDWVGVSASNYEPKDPPAGSGANESPGEAWGAGMLDVLQNHGWRSNTKKVIIVIADFDTNGGHPAYSGCGDSNSYELARDLRDKTNRNNVAVYTMMGDPECGQAGDQMRTAGDEHFSYSNSDQLPEKILNSLDILDTDSCRSKIIDGGSSTGWDPRSCPDGNIPVSVENNGDCSVEGQNECVVKTRVKDVNGNTYTDTARFDIDYTDPSTGIGDSGTWYWSDFRPDVTTSGAQTCEYWTNDDSTPNSFTCGTDPLVTVGSGTYCSSQGTNACTVTVRATDRAGNTKESSASYNIDYTDPSTSDDYSKSGWQKRAQDITLTCSDRPGSDNAGCDRIEWRIKKNGNTVDSGQTGSSGGTVTVGDNRNGKLTLEYWGIDRANGRGNKERHHTTPVWVDKIPPNIGIRDTSTWHRTPSFSPPTSFSDGGGSPHTCEYRTSDMPAGNWNGFGCNNGPTISIGSGAECSTQGADACTVKVRTRDAAGWSDGPHSADYNIDYTAPQTTDNYPDSKERIWHDTAQTVPLTCNDRPGSDNAGCEGIKWTVTENGNPVKDGQETGASGEVTVGDTENGKLVLTYWGIDQANNDGNVESPRHRIEIWVDKVNPHPKLADDPEKWKNQSFDLTVDDSDQPDLSGLNTDTCQYRVTDSGGDSTGWTDRGCPDGGFTVPVGPTTLCSTQGTNTCTIETRVTDIAGNRNTDQRVYSVDYTKPNVSCDECDAPDPVIKGNEHYFTPTVTDEPADHRYTPSDNTQVQICETGDCFTEYCSYRLPSVTSCSDITEGPYRLQEYCVRAQDRADNIETVCKNMTDTDYPPNTFTVKGGIGDICRNDNECLIGTCQDNICTAQQLPAPTILLH